MEARRWTNPGLPQTLQIAVILLYIDAVFGILSGVRFFMILGLAAGAAGLGIANEKKWGYWVGVTVSTIALLPFLGFVVNNSIVEVLNPLVLIGAAFPLAQFVLLVHPQSRGYQRIWFK